MKSCESFIQSVLPADISAAALNAPARPRKRAGRNRAQAQLRWSVSELLATSVTVMDEEQRNLPFPFNQDLSKVLRHVKAETNLGRKRVANSVMTKSLINAAMRRIYQVLGPGAMPPPTETDQGSKPGTPILLDWLSQRKVAAEMANNPPPFVKDGTDRTLRNKWKSQAEFIADLLAFGLHSSHYLGEYADEIDASAELLAASSDLSEAVHSVCYWDLCAITEMATFRLQLLASIVSEQDDGIAQALKDNYRDILAAWQDVHLTRIGE